jgi:hypothetical protein
VKPTVTSGQFPVRKSVIQGFFNGYPDESKVEERAAAKNLSTSQKAILKWAAAASQNFGDLDTYLNDPKKIECLRNAEQGNRREVPPQTPKVLESHLGQPLQMPIPQSYYQHVAEEYFSDESQRETFLKGDLPTTEDVRGTLDLPTDSEEELEEFEIGLREDERSPEELKFLDRKLKDRNAPHDRIRRQKIREVGVLDSELSSDSGTDTDNSDVESESRFSSSRKRKADTISREKRAKGLLGKGQYGRKMRKLASGRKKPSDIILSSKGKKRLENGKLHPEETFFRKNTGFYEPSLSVKERAKLSVEHTQTEIDDLELLNNLLACGMSISEASGFLRSKFVVGQYRGLFYNPKKMDKTSRAQHRALDETRRPIFSASAVQSGSLSMRGYFYLASQPGRYRDFECYQQRLLQEARKIRMTLLELRKKKPSKSVNEAMKKRKIRVTPRFNPATLADQSTHLFSEDYDCYHQQLSKATSAKRTPFAPLFEGLPNASTPKVSMGDVPTHAARYAFGLKPYAGHEEEVLDPCYNQSGRPRHPYSGKIYISIHPLTDYPEDTGPSQLVDLQNKGHVNLSQVIIPERETQFEGFVEQDRVKATIKAKFPSFDREYLEVYAEKYGLDKGLFNDFKAAFKNNEPGTPEFTFVEASLSKLLAMHSELLAIEKALAVARAEGATLVYRTGIRSFGFTTPDIIKGARQVDSYIQPPGNLEDLVKEKYGEIIKINGNGMACYIRSLVTAGRLQGFIDDEEESAVEVIQDELESEKLRAPGEMIDAGSVTAAQVRHILFTLYKDFDPTVHIVMWNRNNGQIANYLTNAGTQDVWLYYTPGHFDLIRK